VDDFYNKDIDLIILSNNQRYIFKKLLNFVSMNFPNTLTTIRIIIALIAPFYLIDGSLWVRTIVGFLIFLAVATDWLDGWYARRYNQTTKLGKILDPIADKLLVLISFSVFVYLDVLSIWWIIPIFVREIVITIYRFIFLSKNIVVAATQSGKVKTFMQMATLGIAYAFFITNTHFKDYSFEYFRLIMQVALAITLFLTVKSGIQFLYKNWKLIKKIHEIS